MKITDIINKKIKTTPLQKIEQENKTDLKTGLNFNEINAILEKETTAFFPKTGEWYTNCYKKSSDLKKDNLPCNLRNATWLAKMLQNQLIAKGIKIAPSTVTSFVNYSTFFEKCRHEYELEIVKWEIEFIRDGGKGFIIPDGFDEMMNFDKNCDIGFRNTVVQTLTAIGLNEEVVEEGLEKFEGLWKDLYMNRAFSNEFEPKRFYYGKKNKLSEPLPPADETHKDMWLKIRKYEYYNAHKQTMDKYGKIDPEVLMTNETVEKAYTFLDTKKSERIAQIKKYNNFSANKKAIEKSKDDDDGSSL